jgi:hypothetical protein
VNIREALLRHRRDSQRFGLSAAFPGRHLARVSRKNFGETSALGDTSINEPAVIEFEFNDARPFLGECFCVEGASLLGTSASTDFCAPEVSALLESSHGTPAFLRTCRRPHGMGGVTLNWRAVLGLNQ